MDFKILKEINLSDFQPNPSSGIVIAQEKMQID
jgi:hypothetical protein